MERKIKKLERKIKELNTEKVVLEIGELASRLLKSIKSLSRSSLITYKNAIFTDEHRYYRLLYNLKRKRNDYAPLEKSFTNLTV